MNPEVQNQATLSDQVYQRAANMLLHQNKNSVEVKNALMADGISAQDAAHVVNTLEEQIRDAKKTRANKDMIYGALWCVGGIVATAADIGFIFWGAIVFGAIQFFKGLINASGN